jgi:ABC-type multidrug transport system ATPase subunit/ABC-type multidrug transport system permease subunit
MTAELVARVVGATLRYRNTVALDTVDLDLPSGRMIGFIGPDGVGKSSLLALIAGARRIQSGRVEVLGGDMARARHRRAVCPRIAYMPQGLGRNLYATLSITENLEFFGRLFGQEGADRRRRIAELLAATGLSAFSDRPVGKLSGGMKQKLGLCCALIHDPDLLILDEPTTGVDPLSRRQFWQLIARLRARRPHMSVLVATAYFEEAEAFDQLVAMDAGRILAFDTPGALKARLGAKTLEEAFVSLLPAAKRDGRAVFSVPPRTAGDDEIAIEAEALSRAFGDFVAVDQVSFRIRRGEIFGFLGSNGCGKTTTMKMLTGLLPASGGSARLFGQVVDARDLALRRRVGFMSQSFSLYTELTVRQNLALHARLFHLPRARIAPRIAELLERFGLGDYVDETAENLPLGVRQRLSLAVAVIHEPEMLILDEPTSGVDPVARDRFWALLIDLSRHRGVTIFISTHFMNEAERCDRISLMHAGRVLTQGAPAEIVRAAGTRTLEEAFIAELERTDPSHGGEPPAAPEIAASAQSTTAAAFSFRRLWAYAQREALEIRRDPIRLAFAVLGPVLLMVVFGFGITFDIERLAYATLDRDRSPESRLYLEGFSSSRYFEEHAALADDADIEGRMRSGELRLAIEIPPGFGRDLRGGRAPEVAVWLDGAFPFRAETSRGYAEGVHQAFVEELGRRTGRTAAIPPADIQARFRYNQDFRSIFAVIPGVLMMLLVFIPAIMSALGVVREKELGSIINLYVTPVTGLEFLLGKQLPYVGVALINFATLLLMALFVFGVPVKGSFAALALGAVLYCIATTGLGLLVSSFLKTQIAAIFAAAIVTTVPAIQYSGFMMPVSSMSPDAQAIGRIFPSTYFQQISVGAFTKALDFAELGGEFFALVLISIAIIALARAGLRTQQA